MFKINVTPGVYRHYQGGIYEVVSMAFHSETMEELVVYRTIEKDIRDKYEYFVHPAKTWNTIVNMNTKTRRYEPVMK
ncbi:MAG: DUF1653 domain-containing protein [Firmicutes bacterium]|nr:DUF1653 domain-containing protein [Bacillota bacterium]